MLKYIKEFGKHIAMTGFRRTKIRDVGRFIGKITKEKPASVEIQFFDAKYVATWQHLYFAALNALTAFRNRANISKSLMMESILYASTQRQIRKAMELIGIKPNTSEIAVLIIGENLQKAKMASRIVSANVKVKQDETVLELSEKKKKIIQKTFGVSDLELKTVMKKDGREKALLNIVIERMALLAIQR